MICSREMTMKMKMTISHLIATEHEPDKAKHKQEVA